MVELFYESIRLVNLPYTIFFLCAVLYWALYLIGVLGHDVLHLHGHADVGTDLGHGHGDLGGDAGAHGHGVGALFDFVYAADVPVTVIASVLSFCMWAISILLNYYTGNTSMLLAAGLALPVFAGGLVATKVVLKPFVPLLKVAFDQSSDVIHVIGQLCKVTSLEATPRHGQAEVPLKGAPLQLNVKTRAGVTLKKGDEAVVIARENDGTYIIVPFGEHLNKEDSPAV
jgi:hypothetical protein